MGGFVRDAVNEIGYTREYQQRWGAENAICGDMLNVSTLISQQSPDIAQGLDGWGDQGIFFGYCAFDRSTCGMPYEHTIAKRICKHLFDSGVGGLDIKAQVITDDGEIKKLIVAIPLQDEADEKFVRDYLCGIAKRDCEIIINGTGRYVQHSPIADCGTTGRKLAVGFTAWPYRWRLSLTKDGSKADLTLNLVARKLARGSGPEVRVRRVHFPRLLHRQTGSRCVRVRRSQQHSLGGKGDNQPCRTPQGFQARHAYLRFDV